MDPRESPPTSLRPRAADAAVARRWHLTGPGGASVLAVLIVLVVAAATLVASARPAVAAGASSADAARFVRLVNGERSGRGLATLSRHGELDGIAVAHSRRMAGDADGDGACNDAGGLRHRDPVSQGIDAPWTALAENVGYWCPADVDRLHRALMDSSSHRANILSGRMRHVGVGAYHDADGGLWVTQIFMDTEREESTEGSSGGSTSERDERTARQPAPAPTTPDDQTGGDERPEDVTIAAGDTEPAPPPGVLPRLRGLTAGLVDVVLGIVWRLVS